MRLGKQRTVLVLVSLFVVGACGKEKGRSGSRPSGWSSGIRPEPRQLGVTGRSPAGRTASVRIPAAFDLPRAPGVKPIDASTVASLPLVRADVARVVSVARTRCRKYWYAVYEGGRKVGYIMASCEVKRSAGPGGELREVYVEKVRIVTFMKRSAKIVRMEIDTLDEFDTSGKGELLLAYYRGASPGHALTIRLTRQGESWLAVRTLRRGDVTDPPQRHIVTTVRTNLSNIYAALATLLVDGKLRLGHTVRQLNFDPLELTDTFFAVQLVAKGTRRWRGRPIPLYKIEDYSQVTKLHSDRVVDALGYPLFEVRGDYFIRREQKQSAKRVDLRRIRDDRVIKARLPVASPACVRKLRLRLVGPIPKEFAQSPRQRIGPRTEKSMEMTISVESLKGMPAVKLPVTDARFRKSLEPTGNLEANHPEIKALAQRTIGNAPDALTAARRLNKFVFGYLRVAPGTDIISALAILRAKEGDCTESARLMTAVCRAVGIPAREVGGLTYSPAVAGFARHRWVEVWVGRWIAVDPSWGEFPANATHIYLGRGSDHRWTAVLAGLRIEAISAE